ncbi:ATP-binding protein [Mangrovihabitans endophyticus]|uniref:ATP-binding protein n=1 Tax=Mangrovihabitans endophyticus TaxID=1751298 RepID=A0A8J3C1N6_9ACTN|nr:ATP-binding protein [Mangrovihabitans endophyticus]
MEREDPVEVKIGVQYAPRELTLESAQTPAEVEQVVTEALAKDSVLSLTDEKGRKVIVPVAKLAYVEIAESSNRPFGFTSR